MAAGATAEGHFDIGISGIQFILPEARKEGRKEPALGCHMFL